MKDLIKDSLSPDRRLNLNFSRMQIDQSFRLGINRGYWIQSRFLGYETKIRRFGSGKERKIPNASKENRLSSVLSPERCHIGTLANRIN
jgi:hypothetical protein